MGLKTGDTDDKLPTFLRVGAAYRVAGPLSIAGDFSNDKEFRLGTEYAFGMVSVRLGMADEGLTFGGGLVFKNRYRMDLAVLTHPALGMSQRISLGYRFGAVAPAAKGRKMQFFAGQFLGSAQAALKKRDYLKASSALDIGVGIDPKLGGGEWRAKAERLRRIVKKMDLDAHPEDAELLSQETEAAYIAIRGRPTFRAGRTGTPARARGPGPSPAKARIAPLGRCLGPERQASGARPGPAARAACRAQDEESRGRGLRAAL